LNSRMAAEWGLKAGFWAVARIQKQRPPAGGLGESYC